MKKVIIPIAVVIVIIIAAVLVTILVSGNGLSGTYKLSNSEEVRGPRPFEFTDFLYFDGDSVTCMAEPDSDDKVTITSTITYVYSIEDDKFILAPGFYSFDFKIDGDFIYINDSVWRKSQ